MPDLEAWVILLYIDVEFRSLDVWEAFVKDLREKAAEKLAKKPNLDLYLDEGEDSEIQ